MTAMSVKREIGIVLGLTGTLFLLLHLALMMFTDLARRFHNSEAWVVIGVLQSSGVMSWVADRGVRIKVRRLATE